MKQLDKPDPAPVTMAVLPANDIAMFSSEAWSKQCYGFENIGKTSALQGAALLLYYMMVLMGVRWLAESLPALSRC